MLLIGYAPWPMSWQARLPGQFAATIRDVSRYLQEALVTAGANQPDAAPGTGSDGAGLPAVPDAGRRNDRSDTGAARPAAPPASPHRPG